MKLRTALAIITLITFCNTATSQKNKFSAGVGTGVSLVSLNGNEILDTYYGTAVRPTFAIFGESVSKKDLILDLSINYEQKGASINRHELYDNLGNNLGYGKGNTILSYITVAPHIGKYFGSKAKFGIRTGPFVGFFLDHKQKLKLENGGSLDYDGGDELYKKTDFGLSTALNASFPLSSKLSLDIFVSNQLGLSDVSSQESLTPKKTNTINFIVFLKFQL